jgi:hypothetical protein
VETSDVKGRRGALLGLEGPAGAASALPAPPATGIEAGSGGVNVGASPTLPTADALVPELLPVSLSMNADMD